MHARNHEHLHTSRVTRPRIWTGLLLNESYRVGSLIEQGATTELYDGTEISTGEPVALKILLPQLAGDAKTRTLFLEEARVLTRLLQPGLHRYRSCSRDPQSDLTYIVTDVVGTRLSSRLGVRKLSQQEIVDFTKRIALALGAAHRAGLVHRNLRPHAIALPDGKLSDAVVSDFNLIKAAHSGKSRDFDAAMLDRAFCAPEQVSSAEDDLIGPWTDVYSLALVVLAAIGVSGTETPDLTALPRKLRPVFERMLDTKPTRRLQSMDDVVRQLDLAIGSQPLKALLDRAPSISLPRVRRAAPPPKPVLPPAEKPAGRALPPLPESLLPAKRIPLAKFHDAPAAANRLSFRTRTTIGFATLLLAAAPWILQTSVPSTPADASTVAPTVEVAQPVQPVAPPLPVGQVYGADNRYSRVTLRAHRATKVVVHSRGERLLFSRVLQPGDTYRAPSLPNLTVTADDGAAVEIVLNGASAGFVGESGARVALPNQVASVAPARTVAPAALALSREEAEAVTRGLAVIEQQATTISEAPAPEVLPEPSVAVLVTPRAAEVRDIPLATVPVAIPAHPAPEEVAVAARRRPVLDFLIPWRRPAQAETEETEAPQAVPADRAARNRSFFNSTLGVTAPY